MTETNNDPRLAVAAKMLESVCSDGNADPAKFARDLIAALDAVDPVRTIAPLLRRLNAARRSRDDRPLRDRITVHNG